MLYSEHHAILYSVEEKYGPPGFAKRTLENLQNSRSFAFFHDDSLLVASPLICDGELVFHVDAGIRGSEAIKPRQEWEDFIVQLARDINATKITFSSCRAGYEKVAPIFGYTIDSRDGDRINWSKKL